MEATIQEIEAGSAPSGGDFVPALLREMEAGRAVAIVHGKARLFFSKPDRLMAFLQRACGWKPVVPSVSGPVGKARRRRARRSRRSGGRS